MVGNNYFKYVLNEVNKPNQIKTKPKQPWNICLEKSEQFFPLICMLHIENTGNMDTFIVCQLFQWGKTRSAKIAIAF